MSFMPDENESIAIYFPAKTQGGDLYKAVVALCREGRGVKGGTVTTMWDEQYKLTPDAVVELLRIIRSGE